MSEPAVLTDVADGVMTITINRPAAKNAVNKDVAVGIAAALDQLDADDNTHVVILTGAGGTFCSGMDLKAFVTGETPTLKDVGSRAWSSALLTSLLSRLLKAMR